MSILGGFVKRKLTEEAWEDREEFEDAEFGGCSCHIAPPCSYCVHPGNPINQEENDECWEAENEKNNSI